MEGGTVEGAGTYDGGTVITLTATPNAGYSFIHWKENGKTVSSNANYSFAVTTDRDLVAFFSLPLTISVTTNMAAGGTTTGAGTYEYGNTCTLTATPNEGYLFLNWSKNGEVVSCNATYGFTVTKDAEIEAVFMRLEGTLIGQGESTDLYLPSNSNWKYIMVSFILNPDFGCLTVLQFRKIQPGKSKLRFGGRSTLFNDSGFPVCSFIITICIYRIKSKGKNSEVV